MHHQEGAGPPGPFCAPGGGIRSKPPPGPSPRSQPSTVSVPGCELKGPWTVHIRVSVAGGLYGSRMDNISFLVGADTQEDCPVCGAAIVITTAPDGTGSELSCDCCAYLVA